MDARGWDALAVEVVQDMLDSEKALLKTELFAKAADRPWRGQRHHIDPHHLSNGVAALILDGSAIEVSEKTRGGRSVPVLLPSDLHRRRTAVLEASARKRLLHARYLGWALGTQRVPRGLIGTAGERVAHSRILAAAPVVGFRVERPEGGDVATLLGAPVEGGALDNAFHLPLVDEAGVPYSGVTCPVEVKNVREWIYRGSARLHQLLYKGALLQLAHPERSFVPVLICRRAHLMTFRMAELFGFYVAQTKAQFLLKSPEVRPAGLFEVRSELGYVDLVPDDDPRNHHLLDAHLRKALPRVAAKLSARWREHGSQFVEVYRELRDPSLPNESRNELALELYIAMREIAEAIDFELEPEEDAGSVD